MAGTRQKESRLPGEPDRYDKGDRGDCIPVHIHIHNDRREGDDEPCININVNVSQGTDCPEFTTCFGDTYYIMDGSGTHEPPGGNSTDDPPPGASQDGGDDDCKEG